MLNYRLSEYDIPCKYNKNFSQKRNFNVPNGHQVPLTDGDKPTLSIRVNIAEHCIHPRW